jgi:aspartyl-tRNA(Asn)/glutamyl-tRNA(Gln) amidotransferase subunit A
MELNELGVEELLGGYASGRISPVDVMAACLARIAVDDPTINSVLSIRPEAAMRDAAASAARWRAGSAGPLDGVPFGVKDLLATTDLPTTGGSIVYADYYAPRDAAVIASLSGAGAILVAKLKTLSFAVSDEDNRYYGRTLNPRNLEHSIAGSSSGSAAALAANFLPLTIGTDTGGSIRVPSAWSGVCGLKPTYNRVPRDGLMFLSWSLDHIGPMARSAADVARVLPVIGPRSGGGGDPRTGSSPRRYRIGMPTNWFFEDCDDEVAEAVRAVALALQEAGHRLVDIEIPHADMIPAIRNTVVMCEGVSMHEDNRAQWEAYDTNHHSFLHYGRLVPAVDYLRALRCRRLLQDDFGRAFESVDIVLAPTVPALPPRLESRDVLINGRPVPIGESVTHNTSAFNITGMPAITVPAGYSASGLPIGVMFAARPHHDEDALAVAIEWESMAG